MTAPTRVIRSGLALLVALASLPAVGRLYGPGWVVPVLGAVVAAVAIDLVVRLAVPRGHGALLVVVQVLVAGLWTTVLVRPGLDGATALGGVGDGVARLLSGVPPVDARGPELGAAVVACWAVAAVTVAILARPRPTLLAVVPPLGLFAAALALGDPARALADRSTALLAVALGLVLVAAARPPSAEWAQVVEGVGSRAPGPTRLLRPVAAAAVLVAVVGVAVAVTPSLPGLAGRSRVDVRARVVPPVEVLLGENPLDTVALQRSQRERPIRFTAEVELPGGADGRLYWRLAVLDDVGPGGWRRAPAAFTRAGRSLGPPPAGTTDDRAVATARVRLGMAPAGLPLLPTLDRPLTVAPSGLAVDPRTGELAVPAGDVRPDELELRAAVPTYGTARLSRTPAVRVAVPADLPAGVAARARLAGGTGNDLQRLLALKASVEQDPLLRLDVVRTGNTADATIADLLAPPLAVRPEAPDEADEADEGRGDDGPPAAVARPVNAAQVSAAFALLARTQGFDVRLVVGYLTPVTGRSASLRVTDDQLTVWSEVRFEGLGWVPIRVAAPTGGGNTGGEAPPDAEGTSVVDEAAEQQQRPQPAPETPAAPDSERPPPASPDPGPAPGGGGRAVVVLGAFALAFLLLAVGPVLRRRRALRRGRGSDDARILGAWDELADRLVEAGVPLGTDLTRPAAVARLVEGGGLAHADEVAWLARHADRAAFAGGPARGTEPAPVPSVADRAWLVPGRVARTLADGRSRPQRAVAVLRWPRRRRVSDPETSG